MQGVFKDSLKLYANVAIQVIDKRTGEARRTIRAHNLVTTAGLDELARRIALEFPVGPDQIAVGDGTTAPTLGDTVLENQLMVDVLGTIQPATASAIFQYLLGGDTVDGESLTEAGILTADDILIARVTHDEIIKGADEAINYTWTFTLGNASA